MSSERTHCEVCRNPRAFCLCSEKKATQRAETVEPPLENPEQIDGAQP